MSSAQQQQAPPEIEATADLPAGSELSLAQMSRIMDVAVALRHERTLAERELNRDETRRMLREKLREAAAVSGGTLTDAEIDAAIIHYYDRLHAFEEPASSWQTFLAHVYIRRTQIAVALTALGAVLAWSLLSLAIWIGPLPELQSSRHTPCAVTELRKAQRFCTLSYGTRSVPATLSATLQFPLGANVERWVAPW